MYGVNFGVRKTAFESAGGFKLTFDDGPNDPDTGQILDILRDKKIKAICLVANRDSLVATSETTFQEVTTSAASQKIAS